MNVYVCTDHAHHWPVGVCSVIVAHDEAEARQLLEAQLQEHSLPSKPFTLTRLDIERARAYVLLDGNY